MIRKKPFNYIAIICCFLAVFTFAVGFLTVDFNINNSEEKTASAATDASSTVYDKFANYSTYKYTDPTKITSARSGKGSDVTVVTVNSSADHGTQNNPYVINTPEQWVKFAVGDSTNTNVSYASTAGKYFVIGKDLDFSSANSFEPVTQLSATLYGLGHTLRNITYTLNDYLGVFRAISKTTLSDLNFDNVNLTCKNCTYMGGICATFYGGYILNCHFKGNLVLSGSTAPANYHPAIGGVAGWVGGGTAKAADTTVYRCSTMVNATLPMPKSPTFGGILSGVDGAFTNNIYDCFSISAVEYTGNNIWAGGILGINQTDESKNLAPIGTQNIENCVAYFSVKSTTAISGDVCIGSTFGGWTNGAVKLNIKDCYSSGIFNDGGTLRQLYPANFWGSSKNKITFTYSGVRWFADSPYIKTNSTDNVYALIDESSTSSKSIRYHSGNTTSTMRTQSDLYTDAQTSSALKSNIWTNQKAITESYMANTSLTATGGYTVANTPLKNTEITTSNFTVTYYDYNAVSGPGDLLGTSNYDYGNSVVLSTQSDKTGGKWLGYTFDKGNGSSPFQSVSDTNYYGDLTLYAVWNAVATSTTVTPSGGADDGGVYTAEFGNNITLTASLVCSDLSDAVFDYEWSKDGTKVGSNSNTLVLRNVSDTGVYTLKYKIRSASRPLWNSTVWASTGTAGTVKVEITGKEVVFNSASFALTSKAFIGMPMKDIKYNAEFLDSNNAQMQGTVTWNDGENTKINSANVTERDGKKYYKTKFTFTPKAGITAYENYKATAFDVEFEVFDPSIVFQMQGISTPITIPATYGTSYAYSYLVAEFEKAFLANLEAGTDASYDNVKDLVPCFMVGSASTEIGELRDDSTTITVNGEYIVNVNFDPKTYNVVFQYIDENGVKQTYVEPVQKNYNYGDMLTAPTITPPTGWVIKDNEWKFTDAKGNTRAWRFSASDTDPADRITANVTLTAEFVKLTLVLQEITVTPNESYVALATIQEAFANLKVVAKYFIDGDSTKPYTINLNYGNGLNGTFKVEIVGDTLDEGVLHYDSNNVIKVTHSYGSPLVTKSQDNISLVVNPINIDTSTIAFNNVTVPYGADVNSSLPRVRRPYPFGVTDVTYKYYSGSTEITDINDIVGNPDANVTYRVRAQLVHTTDYYSEPLTAQFTISAAAEDVYLVWDTPTELPYNGQVQYPKAKVYRVSDNSEITGLDIQYSGNTDKSVPGSYSVTASLGPEYIIRTGDETCAFTIIRAVLPLPTFEAGSMTFNGNPQDILLNNFDSSIMTFTGDSSATNAGDYSVTVTLNDSNYVFDNGESSIDIDWTIDKAMLTVVWDKFKFEANGNVQHPVISRVDGFMGSDAFVDTDFLITGDTEVSAVGGYELTATILNSATWADNYQLRNPKRVFAILPEGMGNVTLITVEWSDNTLKFNNSVQHPSYVVKDMEGNILEDVQLTFGGDYNTSKWAGEYNVTASAGDGYYIAQGSTNDYTITLNDEGEGIDPDAGPNNSDNGPGVMDKIKALIESGFPLWQIVTMAVGALLSLIFMIKAIQYGNRKKQAQNEAKKISAKAYSALLPVFATDVVALGLSNKIWSIMAFAVAGFAVLMLVTMLITRKGWKKAELAKETAIENKEQRKIESQNANQLALQERIAQIGQGVQSVDNSSTIIEAMRLEMEQRRREDEERRRADEERHREEMNALREEQAKRDEAMKIMLANMMGRQQGADGDMGYASMDNTDLLVQKVIAGLLPMVQQMIPETPVYLNAPTEQQDERYDALMNEMSAMRQQMENMSHTVLEAEIIPDHSEEIRAMADEHNAQIAEQNAQIAELQSQIESVLQGRVEGELLPDQTEEIRALNAKIEELQQQIADGNVTVVNNDQSDELRAMAEAHNAEIAELKNQIAMMSSMSVDELDDEDFDDEEEWDSILDEDDDDFVEAVIIDDNGNVRKTYPNFRMRLKQSSDKNREWYAVIKNMFCSQKGVTYRVYKRVEKIRYQGQVVGVIGIAKRSIKLWLALKPYEYDARRYHHKDVSDKPRFVDVPMYVRITSDRALLRAEELILALFQELNMEARKRYNDRSIQELIFTLKHNRLLTNKQYKSLLCETMHVHDCDVLDDETAEKCIENKHVDSIDDSYIATIKLDDIDANFQDGNRVTLERLKKVGLVPDDCTGFTVTAGQRLTKPLIIVANDFTLDAVKLITLTGGRAIRLTLV